MVYAPGTDAAAHRRFHAAFLRGPTVTDRALRGMRAAGLHPAADIIVVGHDARGPPRRAAAAALKHASTALGAAAPPMIGEGTRVVLAVRSGKVLAVACVQRVGKAVRASVRADARVTVDSSREIVAQMCGVSVLWVAPGKTRQGLASKMLDVARANLAYAYVFPKSSVAFTSPTALGARFALRYAPQPVASQPLLDDSCVSDELSDEGEKAKDASEVLGYILVYGSRSATESSIAGTPSTPE